MNIPHKPDGLVVVSAPFSLPLHVLSACTFSGTCIYMGEAHHVKCIASHGYCNRRNMDVKVFYQMFPVT